MYAKFLKILLKEGDFMTLKQLRTSYEITQLEAACSVGVPLRTYARYESVDDTENLKYQKIVDLLRERYEITEDKGVYKFEKLKSSVVSVLEEYKDSISFCYLFGSYAKNYATESSDVDLCVDTTLTGFAFVGLIERLRETLKKNVDLIRIGDLKNNIDLVKEIMKDGIKIYG